ncbi:hypothetical protein M2266_002205 [Streptomyces sp. SPB162]|nr:hypothetical protein [Streptomyces sp. SPB162]
MDRTRDYVPPLDLRPEFVLSIMKTRSGRAAKILLLMPLTC